MEQETVAIVRDSWARVVPISEAAGRLFYANLFEADPGLRALFKGDIDQQAAKLMQVAGFAVDRLDDLPSLLPALRQLGERHVDYGVQPAHYATVGAALLKTLEQGLGPDFTPAARDAWTAVYGVLAGVMTRAAGR